MKTWSEGSTLILGRHCIEGHPTPMGGIS